MNKSKNSENSNSLNESNKKKIFHFSEQKPEIIEKNLRGNQIEEELENNKN